MTKKIFLGMSAMAMLFATSCKDDFAESFVGDQATVEFSISTPEIGTRAYSNGKTATVLQYAIYDGDGNLLEDLTVRDGEINSKTSFSLQLKNNKDYQMVVWAAAPEAPYTVTFTDKIEDANMKVSYDGATCNDEKRDAFYACKEFTVNNHTTVGVELKRPFAQLNIGASDFNQAKKSGYEPNRSQVTVKNIYTTLNLETGTVDGETNVIFEYAELPNETEDGTFPVADNDYLAMNYVLVGADQTTHDIVIEHKNTNTSEGDSKHVGSVPLKRNYRTNIYGKLLTSQTDVNIEIKPGYDKPDYTVETADELKVAIETAIASGQNANIELTSDIALAETLVIAAPTTRSTSATPITIEIDGKGKTLYYSGSGTEGRAIDVRAESNGVNLTLKNLTIDCTASYCQRGINYNTNGTLELDGVTVKGTNVTYALNLPGSSDGANVTINNSSLTGNIALNVWGENMKINAENSQFTSVDNSTAEGYSAISLNNDGADNVANGTVVTINGGKIIAKDENGELSNAVRNATETGRVDISSTTEVIGNTKEPVANVIYEGYNEFYSCTTLQAAIDKAIETKGSVKLIKSVELSEPVTINGNVTLDLNGKTVNAPSSSAFVAKEGAELTIKNGKVVAHESTVSAQGGKIIVESGEYTSTGTAVDPPATRRYSLDCREGGELVVNGGTFKSNNGMINVSSTVTINGGKFENIVEKTMTRHFAYVSATLTINDGEFYGKANSGAGGCFFCGAAAGCDIQINGGKFTSLWTSGSVNKIFEVYYGGTINVTGGLFNTNGGINSFVVANTDAATMDAYPYMAK